MPNYSKIRSVEDRVLAILFLLAISMPVAGLVFHWKVMKETDENRRLAKLPALPANASDLNGFPAKFTDYFNDNFGFRPPLINLQAFVRLKWFGTSASPRVIVGKDGWFFLAAEFSANGKHMIPRFTPEQLEHWKQLLEARRDWLARQKIQYLFVVFPMKDTVYPEFLPSDYQRDEESRFEQLLAYLKSHSSVQILDLRPALIAAKTRQQVYYKTDAHWNLYGGLIGYQAIITELGKSFPQLRPLSESDCIAASRNRTGDLVRLLGLSGYINEESVVLSLRKPIYTIKHEPITLSLKPINTLVTEAETERLRLVMFDDSGGSAVIPFLPQHFRRAVFVGLLDFDPVLVKSEHPDIVIQEVGEMYLADDSILNLAQIELKSDVKGATPFTVNPGLEQRSKH